MEITIPAREVRPGDVLFGMTVETSKESTTAGGFWFIGTDPLGMWLAPDSEVTVERPVPSDPIGTVRAQFVNGQIARLFRKVRENEWLEDGVSRALLSTDTDIAHFPILWKPGMPIPSEEN